MDELTDIQRFNDYVAKGQAGDCWLWTGSLSHGYGQFKLYGKNHRAHRAAWLLAGHTIPEGKCVLHKCDNPACVNVDHLWVGTQADNMADMKRKGRWKRPACHHS